MERLDAAIVIGGPAAVLVAADFAFEPVHGNEVIGCQLTVYREEVEKKNAHRLRNRKKKISVRSSQRTGDSQNTKEKS